MNVDLREVHNLDEKIKLSKEKRQDMISAIQTYFQKVYKCSYRLQV